MATQATLSTNSRAAFIFPRRGIRRRILNQSPSSSSPPSFSHFLSLAKSRRVLTSRRASSPVDVFEGGEEPSPPVPPFSGAAAWCLAAAALCYLLSCRPAAAAEDSIRASGIGLKVAAALRRLGLMDEAVVFALATLPVIELRGAIPVGYWMQLSPSKLTVLSILGNMVPVPFIILYLNKLTSFASKRSAAARRIVELVLDRAKEKAAPVREFQWLGLMLFVAVPFPGTGAWTGAIIAAVLGMEFWSAVSANFLGVVFAGLLVNLLVNLGLKLAAATGVVLFLVSTFMWGVLRQVKGQSSTSGDSLSS